MRRLLPVRPTGLATSLAMAFALLLLWSCGDSRPARKESRPRTEPVPASTDEKTTGDEIAESTARPEEDTPATRVAKLTALLDSQESEKRKLALNQLAGFPDKELARTAWKAIQGCLDDENPEVRALAGLATLKIRGKDGTGFVRPLLKDPDMEVRATVLNELGKLGKEYSDELIHGLQDPSPEIQEVVLDHLSKQKNQSAATQAVILFKKTESVKVRAQALSYLLAVKSDKGTAVVHEALEDIFDGPTLMLAVRYLGQYGKPVVVKSLVSFLNDRDAGVRREAARVMVERNIKTRDSIANLVYLLKDDAESVRHEAHEALKKLTSQDFKFDPRELDAEKARPALEKWEKWMDQNLSKFPEE